MDPETGLEAFCRIEFPRLVGALSLYCGDAFVAEELAQETLARACAQWRRVQQMESPAAWTHRVALNLAASHYRRGAAERRVRERLKGSSRMSREPDLDTSLTVRAVVAGLPTAQREGVVLRFYLGFTVALTAEIVGRTESAVKSDVTRAARMLRAGLGQKEQEGVHRG